MPLTLITGPPGSGKTRLLHDAVREAAASGVPVLLLPSMPDVRRARDELVAQSGLTGVSIDKVDRYLASAWQLRGDGRRLVTALQRTALLRSSILEAGLPDMTESATTPGFLSVLERLAELQSFAVTPHGNDLAFAIARALEVYAGALGSHCLLEPAEATRILSERVHPHWFDGPLFANRFDDLTATQELFFLSAAKVGVDVRLAITGGDGSRMTEATDDLIGRLRGAVDTEIQMSGEVAAATELGRLEQALLQGEGLVESSGEVVLSVAFGEEAEAERIVAEVLSARDAGIELGSLAVVYRDVRRHHAALRRALAEAGLPADFDVQLRFSEIPFGRAVMALLGFAATGDRVSLVAFLSSGYARLRVDDVDELDALWRCRGGEADARRMLADIDRLGADARRFVSNAVGLAREGARADNAEAWKDLAGEMLANAHGRNAPILGNQAVLDAHAHHKLCEAVDDLSSIVEMGAVPVGLYETLGRAWVALAGPATVGRVQVMDVERVRGRRFDCVIMPGLTTGEFPRTSEEGVFESPAFRARLEEQHIVVPRDGGLESERLLFFTALTRARRRLVLSRQEADSDGRPVRTSILLEEVLAAYGSSAEANTVLPEHWLAFADLGLHPEAPGLARRALRSVALSDGGNELPAIARARARQADRPERITDVGLLATLAGRRVFSATELESYLACPYSWFYERFLHPAPLEERGDALLLGSVAHEALAAFYAALPDALGAERVTPANTDDALALCDAVLDSTLERRLSNRGLEHRMLGERIRQVVTRLVRRDAEFLPGFAPRYREWSFGLEDDPEDFGEFLLSGRVDRVDTGVGGCVVIDYKSGGVTAVARFESDGLLQAPLYAEVVRRRIGGRVAGTFYRSLSGRTGSTMNRGAYDPALLSGPELCANDAKCSLDEVIEGAIARARGAAAGIRSGHIVRRPLSDRACAYCGARSWCREAIS